MLEPIKDLKLHIVPEQAVPELNLPSCFKYTGQQVVCGTQRLPIYESGPREDGRPSINTLEGWNLYRRESAAAYLKSVLHRDPTEAEIDQQLKEDAALCRHAEN